MAEGIITRSEALAAMSDAALRHRIRPGGPWQVVLPGIYATFTGRIDEETRFAAALAYVGKGGMLTSATALRLYGIRYVPQDSAVHVLSSSKGQRHGGDWLHLTRTHRPPPARVVEGWPCAPVERAVSDWARSERRLDNVRAVTASTVQLGRCDLPSLRRELEATARRGSAKLRLALGEVGVGIRSVAEAHARRVILTSPTLPEPLWNPSLYASSGFLASPDGYWPEAGLASEVDSAEWHLGAREANVTSRRRARMEAAGIRVIANPPSRWRDDAMSALRELEAAHRHGLRTGPPPGLVVVPRVA
jgi:hypothetical protein